MVDEDEKKEMTSLAVVTKETRELFGNAKDSIDKTLTAEKFVRLLIKYMDADKIRKALDKANQIYEP